MDLHTDGEWHRTMLRNIAARMKPSLYVELGIEAGWTYLSVKPHCARSIGVDISTPNCDGEFYEMTTDEFFAKVAPDLPPFELTFIDADHHSAQAFEDFTNAYRHTMPNGLILLHDTWPENEKERGEGFCCDSYKVPDIIRGCCTCELITFPFPPGLTIVRKP